MKKTDIGNYIYLWSIASGGAPFGPRLPTAEDYCNSNVAPVEVEQVQEDHEDEEDFLSTSSRNSLKIDSSEKNNMNRKIIGTKNKKHARTLFITHRWRDSMGFLNARAKELATKLQDHTKLCAYVCTLSNAQFYLCPIFTSYFL